MFVLPLSRSSGEFQSNLQSDTASFFGHRTTRPNTGALLSYVRSEHIFAVHFDSALAGKRFERFELKIHTHSITHMFVVFPRTNARARNSLSLCAWSGQARFNELVYRNALAIAAGTVWQRIRRVVCVCVAMETIRCDPSHHPWPCQTDWRVSLVRSTGTLFLFLRARCVCSFSYNVGQIIWNLMKLEKNFFTTEKHLNLFMYPLFSQFYVCSFRLEAGRWNLTFLSPDHCCIFGSYAKQCVSSENFTMDRLHWLCCLLCYI